jgi:hypothetical protein
MANPTTNYGFVLPTSTDLVTDLPADFDVALQGVDTRLKALQPGTTLGDLAYSSATANTNTRLAVGANGTYLTVTSGVPAWGAISAGGMTLLSTTTLSGTSVTISSISQDYNNLVFIGNGVSFSEASGIMQLKPNNVAASGRYSYVTNSVSTNTSIFPIVNTDYASNSNDSFYLCINNYTSSKHKPTNFFGGNAADDWSQNAGGSIRSTSAITSMVVTTTAGTATLSGTILTYGVK